MEANGNSCQREDKTGGEWSKMLGKTPGNAGLRKSILILLLLQEGPRGNPTGLDTHRVLRGKEIPAET